MSTTKIFKAGLIASVGVAGLTLTANAQSRYGNVYDYESGKNCGQACVPAPQAAPVNPTASSRYGAPAAPVYTQAPAYNPAPVYVDCQQTGTCAPQPAVIYTQPAPVMQPTYTQPTYTQPTYTQSAQMAPVNCPAGTTAQSDGTCMQTGSTSTYSAPSTSYSAPAPTMMEPVNCPSGTTAQSDGTCMQTGSTSTYSSGSSYSSGSTYSAPSTTMMEPVNCPAGTTAQSDGTCMQGGSTSSFSGSAVDLYMGDATSTPAQPSYGYTSNGSYGRTDYLPVRK